MLKWLKRISTKNLILEIFFLSFVVIAFDIIFVMRFDFSIPFTYWIIALLNVAFFVGLLALIKSNKKRFRAHMIYLFSMFVLFVSNSTLYYFKSDISSVATLTEMFKSSMQIGLKYNPFTAYDLLPWLGIALFVGVSIYVLRKIVFWYDDQQLKKPSHLRSFVLIAALVIFVSPLLIKDEDVATFDTPQDKTLFIQTFGSVTFYARDIVVYATTIVEPLFNNEQFTEYLDSILEPEPTEASSMFGQLKDQNIIMIMCETCESYAFDPILTPNYYRLYNESLVYENAFSAAKRNYTYDAEFKALTSMMYSGLDNYMYTFEENTFNNALPYVLTQEGYSANSFHNYYESFFNRNIIHPSLGFENFYGLESLVIEPTDFWPLDSWMFDQMKDEIVPVQENPFFSFIITVTPHGPHDHERQELLPYYEKIDADGRFNDHEQAFKTLMAAQMDFDEGLGIMLDDLELKGLMEKTIIVFFSDHKNYSTHDITDKYEIDSDIPYEVEKIPFLIYHDSFEHEIIDIYTSHYDVTPTLFDVLGITVDRSYYYGQSLFLEARENLPIILTHSRWVLPEYRVMDNEVVLGEVDEEAFMDMQAYIYEQFIKYESMFKADYFLDRDVRIYIE